MTKPATKKSDTFGPNILDSRVRERFLASGHLDPKVLEKHLAELADSTDKGDSIDLRQPALSATSELIEEEDDE